MANTAYQKALELLHRVATPNGFLASAENTTNYQRVWARDGVICGLAAMASGDNFLIETFKNTLTTLAQHQHALGTIPSNVALSNTANEVSYGGLAGRVDAVTWFIIGICQYGLQKEDADFVAKYSSHIEKGLTLLESWEFNNKHLIYVPLSGNWADEYITDGYVLYDQLLRIWALKSYNHFAKSEKITEKIKSITTQIETNFFPNTAGEKYHERAYNDMVFQSFAPCSFSPAGYKTQFDAFANALLVLLNIGSSKQHEDILNYSKSIAENTTLGLLPAFWPPIFQEDDDWNLLKNNCKYHFRNYPYEFHNGGSWPMVNGFWGLAMLAKEKSEQTVHLLEKINQVNAINGFSFYENFNTKTQEPNGVAYCAWSAAATILVHQSLQTNFKLFF